MSESLNPFARLMPGYDFLQNLVKNAGSSLPGIGHWVAPTLDPDELKKRIDELRTVQFWLEQNARMLGTTIQAMEVQRMTLSTLKTMNLSMGDLADSLKIRVPEATRGATAPAAPSVFTPAAPAPAPAPASRFSFSMPSTPAPAPAPVPEPEPPAPEPAPAAAAESAEAPAAPAGVIDPMQWWGALTQQFSAIAAQALKDNPADAARQLAEKMVQPAMNAAQQTIKMAAQLGSRAAQAGEAAAGAKAKGGRKAAAPGDEAPARAAKTARKAAGKAAAKAATRAAPSAAAKSAPKAAAKRSR